MTAQRGAAVILAMLVLTVAVTLVTGLLWRQDVLARRLENQFAYVQTRQLMAGAIDWVRVILREDARSSNVDYLGEPWSVPLSETRLDADDGEYAFLSGAIADEQSKFNVRNLIRAGKIDEVALHQFERLLGHLGLDSTLASAAAKRLLAGSLQDGPTASPILTVDDFGGTPGWEPALIERLRPFVTVLPMQTPVNVNTAAPEVLAAVVAGLSLSDSSALISNRANVYFKDMGDFWNRAAAFGVNSGSANLQVSSNLFLLRGQISYRKALMRAQTLLHRHEGQVTTLWWRENVL